MADIVVGRIGEAQHNRARRTDDGDWVAISNCSGTGINQQISADVYADKGDAEVASKYFLSIPRSLARPEYNGVLTRRKTELVGVTKGVLRRTVKSLDDFTSPMPPGGGPAPPVDPLIGTTKTVSFDLFDASGVMVIDRFNGQVTVASAHPTIPDAFTCDFTHGGTARTVVLSRPMLASGTPPPAVRWTVAPSAAVVGSKAIPLLQTLPYSRTLAAGTLDGQEVIDAIKGAGIPMSTTDHTHGSFDMVMHAAAAQFDLMVANAPAGTVFTNTQADRLGVEVKNRHIGRTLGGGATTTAPPAPAGPRYPLSEALKTLASSDAAWSAFLKRSISYTFVNERKANEATSEFLQKGALEQYLSNAKATTSAIISHALPASLGEEELMSLIMFTFVPADGGVGTLGASALGGPTSHALGAAHAASINVNLLQSDTSGTDEERRLRLTLQDGFAKLDADATASARLQTLHASKDSPVDLHMKVAALANDDCVKLLVTSDGDIEKALAGA